MTEYICKCGRKIRKSTNADVTGNRDTAGCTGCPYLLPWGPTKWNKDRQAYVADVKGYECRATQVMYYGTALIGDRSGKNSLHILSLDFDFLELISRWIKEHSPDGDLSGGFSRDNIRACEYESHGRYSYTVYACGNKTSIAAKAELLSTFFTPEGDRRDISPADEQQMILGIIAAGKAAAQKKDFDPEKATITELAERSALPPFDYSELATTDAAKLQDIENTMLTAKRDYVITTAYAVQAAHDLLAHYHTGIFTAWHLGCGISRGTAQNLLGIAQLLCNSTPEEAEILNTAPATLLYSAARKNAPAELVEQVKAGDITTNAEFQRLKKELEEAQQARDEANRERLKSENDLLGQLKEAKSNFDYAAEKHKAECKKRMAAENRAFDLEEKVKALESRPIDVAVQEPDPAEIERIRANIEKAATMKLTALEEKNRELKTQLEHEHKNLMTLSGAQQMSADFANSIKTYVSTFLMLTKGFDAVQFDLLCGPVLTAGEALLMRIRAEMTSRENYIEEDDDF